MHIVYIRTYFLTVDACRTVASAEDIKSIIARTHRNCIPRVFA